MRRSLESLVGLPHVETFDAERAMEAAIGNYKKRLNNAKRPLNEKIMGGIRGGTIAPGEVAAAYAQANKQADDSFSEMYRRYQHLLQLGIPEEDALDAMKIGFGTEIQKSGLLKKIIRDIAMGMFRPIEISDAMEKDARANFPQGYEEYLDARSAAEIRYVDECYDLSDSRSVFASAWGLALRPTRERAHLPALRARRFFRGDSRSPATQRLPDRARIGWRRSRTKSAAVIPSGARMSVEG